MSDESMKAEMDRLKDENERLKARQSRAVSLKVDWLNGGMIDNTDWALLALTHAPQDGS